MKSPVNQKNYHIKGIKIGVSAAGIRYQDRDDVVVLELCEATTTAATFTQNRFAAAPVIVARKNLNKADTRYLLINAGNANAGTGEQGMSDAIASCEHLANQTECSREAILPFSTGVIGEYLPMDKLQAGINTAITNLIEDDWQTAANAILTTDTRAKLYTHEFTLNGKLCRITGMTKGSGMIHPNMATMLAFVATDAAVPQPLLQKALSMAVDDSFNCITVDGDTSTNDACVVSATGQGELTVTDDDMALEVFTAKLTLVCQQLAEMIIKDGEGATKLARIKVNGGRNKEECKTIAYTVALSPLVKTALFGQDPNWGRILAAVGRAPVDEFDLSKVEIYLDDICIVKNGERDKWYTEEDGARVMQRDEITIGINMNLGDAEIEVLTSDLSHDYVSINADYRS
jgi:glutamate N-acetyltransferase/amino-acid N-acetyltransferase